MNKILAVDFDGTLVENKFPEIGKVNVECVEFVLHAQKRGWKVILHTCREDRPERGYLSEAEAAMRDVGLEFDAINENPWVGGWWTGIGTRKIFAHIYLDDRGMHPSEISEGQFDRILEYYGG